MTTEYEFIRVFMKKMMPQKDKFTNIFKNRINNSSLNIILYHLGSPKCRNFEKFALQYFTLLVV